MHYSKLTCNHCVLRHATTRCLVRKPTSLLHACMLQSADKQPQQCAQSKRSL
jgi:hypothetical protein